MLVATLLRFFMRAHAGAVAQMGDDHPAVRTRAKMIRQDAGDVVVGQAVESVADDAFVGQSARQGEQFGQPVLAAVKAGVETGDLLQSGLPFRDSADRGKIVRLVQRRKRGQRIKRGQNVVGDERRAL